MNQRFSAKIGLCGAVFVLGVTITPAYADGIGLRAGEVINIMDNKELGAYISGLVEGLAYARYVSDGDRTDQGMRCIMDWYYGDEGTIQMVRLAFARFEDHSANAVVAALAERQCGE